MCCIARLQTSARSAVVTMESVVFVGSSTCTDQKGNCPGREAFQNTLDMLLRCSFFRSSMSCANVVSETNKGIISKRRTRTLDRRRLIALFGSHSDSTTPNLNSQASPALAPCPYQGSTQTAHQGTESAYYRDLQQCPWPKAG